MIQIKHVIFSRLEPAYSRKNETGFQVAYSSSNLSPDDVEEVKRRVSCYDYQKELTRQRYQFFVTQSSMAAIVVSTPIKAHKEIIDANERDGAFIAHAVLLRKDDFDKVANNPFVLIDGANEIFASSVDQLYQYLKEIEPPSVFPLPSLDIQKNYSNQFSGNLAAIYALISSRSSTTNTVNHPLSLFIRGSQTKNINQFIRIAIFVTPPYQRITCSFDTHVDGCQPRYGSYWAVGGTRVYDSRFITADLDNLPFTNLEDVIANNESTYENWLVEVTNKGLPTNDILDQIPTAHRIERMLREGTQLSLTDLHQETAASFCAANEGKLLQNLSIALGSFLNEPISKQLVSELSNYMTPLTYLSVAAQKAISSKQLAPIVFQWFIEKRPSVKNWKDILAFAEAAQYAPLKIFASYQLNSPLIPLRNRLNRIEAIRHESIIQLYRNEDYEILINKLFKVVPLYWLVIEENAKSISELCTAKHFRMMNDNDFIQLVQAIIDNGGGPALKEDFGERAKSIMTRKSTRRLKKAIQRNRKVASQFANIVNEL